MLQFIDCNILGSHSSVAEEVVWDVTPCRWGGGYGLFERYYLPKRLVPLMARHGVAPQMELDLAHSLLTCLCNNVLILLVLKK